MNSKRYKLLKDLPSVKAGMIYFKNKLGENGYVDGNSYLPEELGMKQERWAIHADYVEGNEEWFEEVKDDTAGFVWTDELVSKYAGIVRRESINEYRGKSDILDCTPIEKFKLQNLPKTPPRKKLFTTEDGKDIYEGDEYWYPIKTMSHSFFYNKMFATNCSYDDKKFKYFSTESAAREYIGKIKNKEEKLYTQSELEEAEKLAFEDARRKKIRGNYVYYDYAYYKDYKKSKNK